MKIMTAEQKTKIELLIQVAAAAVLSTVCVATTAFLTSPYGLATLDALNRGSV